MPKTRVLVWQEWHWWVAQGAEIDIASQGGSLEEALTNIREALALHCLKPASSWKPPPDSFVAPPQAESLEIDFAV